MGINGMLLVGPAGETETVAARAKQVFDVSGAGDTVVSLLAACRAAAMDWRSAMETASLAAGIVVGKVGTQPVLIREIHDEIRRERDGHFAKIHTVEEAVEKVSLWRAEGDTIVFTNGCFDLLHPGHVHLLNQAASLGSKLVVGLNSDDSVSRLKGPGRPVLGQADRSALLASLQDVDMVIVFDADTPIALIEALGPDVLVKGGDYSRETVVGADLVEARGGRVMLVSLKEGIGTSRIIERIHSSGN
jgi:D-beta-D-heptose 7-phosphate kinase/D-beta-D-heptose 1-phosphate adenosyltransferase